MTTYDASLDCDFDACGVNNPTDARAPLCDCRFGCWSDAHRDTGRYLYLDLRMRFD